MTGPNDKPENHGPEEPPLPLPATDGTLDPRPKGWGEFDPIDQEEPVIRQIFPEEIEPEPGTPREDWRPESST